MFTLLFAYYAATAAPTVPPEAYEAHIRFESVQKALDLYYADCDHYPPTSSGLKALSQPSADCAHWGPNAYLAEIPSDVNGHPYLYFGTNKSYLIRDLGRDGRPGGEGPDRDTDFTRGEINFYRGLKRGTAAASAEAGTTSVQAATTSIP